MNRNGRNCGPESPDSRFWHFLVLLFTVGPIAGCSGSDGESIADSSRLALVPTDEQLRLRLENVLDWNCENRHLNLRDHAAWQVMHGVLAYQQRFLIETEPGGERKPAVNYLLTGGEMKGWNLEPGVVLDNTTGRRGIRAILEAGSKTGQGHEEQWLAKLVPCNLPPSTRIVVDGRPHTLADFVDQVCWDVPRNSLREYSWTLIAITAYLPTSARWMASDGREWSVEELVRIEAEQDIATAACGGTHRLGGLAIALNRHLSQGGKVTGIWKAADDKIQAAIQLAKEHQNPDGSFSSNYLQHGGKSADLTQNIAVSGHVLELLGLAMTDQQIREPWVKLAAAHLCDVCEKTYAVPLDCGGLYHAMRGLDLYLKRRFVASKDRSADFPNATNANAASDSLNPGDWQDEERRKKPSTVRSGTAMSGAFTIRADRPRPRAAIALTMVPLLLWSSFPSFGYFCRDGSYEPFWLALDCCASAHSPRHFVAHGNACASGHRTSQRPACPAGNRRSHVVAGCGTKGLIGFGIDHATSCQPVLKESGLRHVGPRETTRNQDAAGPDQAECRAGAVAVAWHTIRAVSPSWGGLDDLLTVLQRFTI